MSGLIKRSFSLAGHRTSVALEAEFWDVLHAVALSRGMALSALVASVDSGRDGMTPLASSLRVLALRDALDGPRRRPPNHGTGERRIDEPGSGNPEKECFGDLNRR